MDDYPHSRRAEDELAFDHGLDDPFAAAIRATRMAMVVTDARQPDLPIVFANDAFLALTGYGRDEVIGRNCRFLQGPRTDPQTVERIAQAIGEGGDVACDILNYRKDGSTFWNALFLSPVRSHDGPITYFFGSQVDVSVKKEAELKLREANDGLEAAVAARTRDLEQALEQKTALLHEVDHRVKNNLQLISSLLRLQTRRTGDEGVRRALDGMHERVNAVATVHRRLFQNEDVDRFDVAEFVRDLVGDATGAAGREEIKVRLELERVDVPAANAAPLALVINELICNALRHAYPGGRGGEILVALARDGDGCRIEVADDGAGMGDAAAGSAAGFGLTVVKLLCQQLRAECETDAGGPGVRTVIHLPVSGVH